MDPVESFEKRIMSIDDEGLAAIDAKLESARNDPDFRRTPVEWLDDADPFGMDWTWLKPPPDEKSPSDESATGKVVSASSSQPAKDRSRWRPTPSAVVGAALAASLLIGAGMMIGEWAFRGGDWNAPTGKLETLLASATPRYELVRGTEEVLLVEVESERPGFATIISLGPERAQRVFPEPGEELLQVAPSATATYGPLPADSTIALVIVTETPATSVIRDALLDQQFQPHNVDGLNSYLSQLLQKSGYRWLAVGRTTFSRENNE